MDMPRPRPPFLHREVTRHGRVAWYARPDRNGPRVRIRADYGTEGFWAAYNAAVTGAAAPEGPAAATAKPKAETVAWLITRYRESTAWLKLSRATRRQRENIFDHVIDAAGTEPIDKITRRMIIAGRDRRTAAAGRHFVQALRGLYKWAVDAELAAADPTEGIGTPRPPTDGFQVWPEEWCRLYEKRWPVGTRQRIWFEVIYCTGLRRGDAVKVGRQHVKNGRGMIRAEKNGETAYFLVSERLQRALDAGPIGEMTFIVGAAGKPLTKESFGNLFKDACRAAGVPGSAHGIRKTRATIEAEAGASGAKLDALFGWRTGSNTSAIYIRKANRARLAFGPDAEQNGTGYARTSSSGAGASAKKD